MNKASVSRSQACGITLMLCLMSASLDCRAALDDLSELSLIQDVPVVLSASRLRQPLSETPNAVTVIDRRMIKASGFRNLAELFRLVPGMYVDFQSGNEPIVGYRGATDAYSRRMQVLIDGRSVSLPPYNIVDWGDLPLHINDIERIEVVRGPAATSYGSNSILGVINIITRDAFSVDGTSISASKGNAGNADISDAVAHLGHRGGQLDYRLTVGMRSDNGMRFPEDYHTVFDGFNDRSATHFTSLRSNYHPNAADSFDLQLGYSNGVRATGDPQQVLYTPRNVLTESNFQQLTWLHVLDQNDDIQFHYYRISRQSTDERFSLPISGVSYRLSERASAQRQELELQNTVHTGTMNRFVWGAAIRYESVDAPFLFLTPQDLHESRLFAHDEWRVSPPLLLNIGAMLEDDGMGNKRTSPRLSLNYHVTPQHTFRTGVSIAYRNPALGEESSDRRFLLGPNLYQSWLSSGNLRPERALSKEVGYTGDMGGGLSVDVRAYNDQVSNIIWVDAISVSIPGLNQLNAQTWDFRNEFAARYTGMEGTLKLNREATSMTFNFAHQLASVTQTAASTFLPAYVPEFSRTTPRNSGSVLLDGRMNEGVSMSAGFYYQGEVKVLDGIYLQPVMRRLDIRMAKQFGAMRDKNNGGMEVALVIQNILQEHIVGYSGYLFDRRAYATVAVGF